MIKKPRGTRDFLPDEMEERREVERKMRGVASSFGYREICTPTFESSELYTIKSGEGIIEEMYVFEDKGGRSLALRPEGTAAVLRMYVSEGKVLSKPVRWCYLSDCYRYERPQKGRYRQFWQFGAELIGADTAAADAEMILLAYEILSSTGVNFEMHVGHLSPMKHILSDLAEDDRKKVMALLDKKNFEGLTEYLNSAGKPELYDKLKNLVECSTLSEAMEICGDFPESERMAGILDILNHTGMKYKLNLGIVRGLDYYTGMVFEGFAENLGAENQIIGGGSYRLAHLFGGEDVASCGFGIGFDRVMVSLGQVDIKKKPVVAVAYTPEAASRAFEVAAIFRRAGIRAEINLLERGIGAQMKYAAKTATYVALIGARECESGLITLKNLSSGEQKEISPEDAVSEVV
ncbi:histidine--tRNA ligase [Methanoplanus endosymbiosus]|uniref:Histidine--tRNA ligase n=1 Tax=Methanoplanus endosymbiosus TaxID=33865 RepID=A0A9E7TJB6_9EURY|nr:histidine--tRNA ligase [Methanoplanus endosymbiosus]UUX91694.1 histidine--tRNA ligase [Methanoplanus endosymbiosus]